MSRRAARPPLLAAVLWLVLAPLAAGQSLTGGIWEIEGTDVAGNAWRGSTLVFTAQDGSGKVQRLRGYFDWIGSGGQSGRELFAGELFADGTMILIGYELQRASGIVLAGYGARLLEGGDRIAGNWSGAIAPSAAIPGDFLAVRRRGPGDR